MNRIAWKRLSVFVLPVLSVASLLLGLAACGGGGGSSSPPKTMVEAERDQTRITPSGDRYGSLAMSSRGSWAFRSSTNSLSSARAAALAACTGDGCREVLWFRNACGALARSGDNTRNGVGWAVSELDAQSQANAACAKAGGSNCRIASTASGTAASYCIKGGSSPATGQASTITTLSSPTLPPTQYGALALGGNEASFAWAFRVGATAKEAEQSALNRCRDLLGRSCHAASFANACGAIARSECHRDQGCLRPGYGDGYGKTRAEAEAAAIRSCNQRGDGCRVDTSAQGEAGALCVGTAR